MGSQPGTQSHSGEWLMLTCPRILSSLQHLTAHYCYMVCASQDGVVCASQDGVVCASQDGVVCASEDGVGFLDNKFCNKIGLNLTFGICSTVSEAIIGSYPPLLTVISLS